MHASRAVALLVTAPAVAVAVGASPASAAGPTHDRVYLDSSRTFGAGALCDFPIDRRMFGWHSETVKTMQSGVVRDRAYVEDFTYTLTNPANGKSVSSREGGQFTVYEYADGTLQIVITGNDALFTAPHQGFIAGQNGRYVETDLPDGTATVDVATGHFDTGFAPGVCDALH